MFDSVFKGKKVLITGHTGFKGSWLALWLQHLGADICGYSDRVFDDPSHFSLLRLAGHIRHEIGDICDYDRLTALITDFKPDVIFHLAAQALVHRSLHAPIETIKSNTLGTATVLNAGRAHPGLAGLIIITSDKVYENKEWAWGYRETDTLGGKDPYSASKAAAELVINSFLRCYYNGAHHHNNHGNHHGFSGAIVAIGRAGNVIGGGDWGGDRIIPDCIRAWSAGAAASIRNPRSTRPWQHVLEPISGYLRLAQMALGGERKIHGQAYNFGPAPDANYTVEALLAAMSARWPGAEWVAETDKDKLAIPEAGLLKLTCEKAQRDLGWRPCWDFSETVARTIDWYRAYAMDAATGAMDAATGGRFDAHAFGLEQIKAFTTAANAET